MTNLSLSELLAPAHVFLDLPGGDETAAIRAVTALLQGDPAIGDLEKLTAEVLEREALASTALGSGVAFPHARTRQVKQIVVAAGRSREGVAFLGGEERVHFIFVIATPENQVPQYLAAVGKLARLLKNPAIREQLMQATSVEEFLATLQAGG
jgi:mannitol/fructose-specific phosphotransferase system IIA component (Ntr-type)